MYLSIIIPVYNEEKILPKTLIEIDKYLKNRGFKYEIIIVNDGSEDKTTDIVRRLSINCLKIIDGKVNMGKGYAVRRGLLEAKGNYRLFMDADNSTAISEIEKLLPHLTEKHYDIAIGSRSINGSKIIQSQPKYRLILGRLYSSLAKIFIGIKRVDDTQCGFKIFNSGVIEKILPKCQINGWSFDVEILILAQKFNYKIIEVPIKWSNQAETKVTIRGMIKSMIDLVKIKWNLATGRYDKNP